MNVYISVFLFIVLVCFLSNNKGDGKTPLVICISAIYLMISLQSGWGGDWEAYNNLFDHYHGVSVRDALVDDSRWEPGFKVAFSIMPSYDIMKFVFSALYCFALYVFFSHFIPRKWWAFGFLFLFFNRPLLMGGVAAIARIGVAVSSFLVGLYFLTKDKKWVYIVLLIIGSLFHRSALFFLPFVFIPLKRSSFNPLTGLAVLFGVLIVSIVVPSAWFNMVESVIGGMDTFAEYEESLEWGGRTRTFGLLLLFLFFWAYVLFTHTRKTIYNKNNYLVFYIGLIQIVFSLLPEVGLAGRIYFYLNYAFFAGMIVILDNEKDSFMRLAVIATLIYHYGKSFMVFYHSPFFAEHWMHYYPIWLF